MESAPVEELVPEQLHRRPTVQYDEMGNPKRRSRAGGKWELVPAYKLAYKDLKEWLEQRFEGNYELPDHGSDPEANEEEGRLTVEDYYRIILPRALTNEEKAIIDRTLRKGDREETRTGERTEKAHWSDEEEDDDYGIKHGNEIDVRGIEGAEAPSWDDAVATAREEDQDAAPRSPKIRGSNAANTEMEPHSDLPLQQEQVSSGRRNSL